MVLARLFLSFLKTGSFAIGGAYTFLPLLEREIVEKYHWLTKEEFLEMVGVVRLLPGAISVKFATYTGYKMAGVPGAIVANVAILLPPALLIFFVLTFYAKYKDLPAVKRAFNMVQLVVFSMLIAVAFQLMDARQLVQARSLAVVIIAFILFMCTKIHPALIILSAGVLGIVLK